MSCRFADAIVKEVVDKLSATHLAIRPKPVQMSKVSDSLLRSAAIAGQLTYFTVDSTAEPVTFRRYNWDPLASGADVSESQATVGKAGQREFVSLPSHFFSQLPDQLKAKAAVFTVTKNKLAFGFTERTGSTIQQVEVTGYTDACVVPIRTHPVQPLPCSAAIVDWKISAEVSGAQVAAQLFFELLAFNMIHKRQIFAIATDCSTKMRVFELRGRRLIEYMIGGSELSLEAGFGLVCAMLGSFLVAAEQHSVSGERLRLHFDDSDDDDEDERAEEPEHSSSAAATSSSAGGGASSSATAGSAIGGTDRTAGRRRALAPISTNQLALYAEADKVKRQQAMERFFQATSPLRRAAFGGSDE